MLPFYATVVVAGIVNVACYAIVCRKLGSWINCFTLIFGQSLFLDIFLGFTGLHFLGARSSLAAFVFCYATYMASAIAIMLVVNFARPPQLKWLSAPRSLQICSVPWILLGISYLVYLPVLIEFSSFILTPREIYTHTRVGYGATFFVSTFLCDLAFIAYLFKRDRTRFGMISFFLLSAILCLLHGSKGEVVLLGIFYLLFQVHIKQISFGFARSIFIGGALLAVLCGMFLLFIKGDVALLEYMSGYSDYTYNATRVIDSPPPQYPYLGQLMIEQLVYSRIPRFILPSKPTEFGEFRLDAYYDPFEFEKALGAQAYGIGVPYADFGPLVILLIPIESAISAYFVLGLIRKQRKLLSPGLFIILCYLSGLSIIPIDAFTALPEMFVLYIVLDKVLSTRWSFDFV